MSGRHRSPEDTALRELTALGLGLLTVATVAITVAQPATPARLFLTVAFALLAPGWAAAAYLRIREPALLWSAAVALSMAISILLAQVMLSAGYWHPWAAMLGLELVTAGVLLHHVLRWRHPGVLPRFGAAR